MTKHEFISFISFKTCNINERETLFMVHKSLLLLKLFLILKNLILVTLQTYQPQNILRIRTFLRRYEGHSSDDGDFPQQGRGCGQPLGGVQEG